MTTLNDVPLCSAGRCSQLLAAFAEEKARTTERMGLRLHRIIIDSLRDLGVDAPEGRVGEVVAANIVRMIEEAGVRG